MLSKKKFGYYSPKGLIKVIYLFVRMGASFGKLKKVYAWLLKRKNKEQPIDINYHNVKFRIYPHNNTIESKMFISSRLREGKELGIIQNYVKNGGIFFRYWGKYWILFIDGRKVWCQKSYWN